MPQPADLKSPGAQADGLCSRGIKERAGMAKAGAAPFDAGGNGHDEVFSADAAFLLGGCRGSCICRHTLVQLLRQVAKAGHGGIDDRAAVQLHRRPVANHGGL